MRHRYAHIFDKKSQLSRNQLNPKNEKNQIFILNIRRYENNFFFKLQMLDDKIFFQLLISFDDLRSPMLTSTLIPLAKLYRFVNKNFYFKIHNRPRLSVRGETHLTLKSFTRLSS